jgi:hypothetical protein
VTGVVAVSILGAAAAELKLQLTGPETLDIFNKKIFRGADLEVKNYLFV